MKHPEGTFDNSTKEWQNIYVKESAEWLKEQFLSSKLSLKDFAEKISYSRPTVDGWVNKRRPIHEIPWKYICQGLGVEPAAELLAFAPRGGKRPAIVIRGYSERSHETEIPEPVQMDIPELKKQAIDIVLEQLQVLALDDALSFVDVLLWIEANRDSLTAEQKLDLIKTVND